jgi:putative methionine-R-sulfoxide reductase with GAF domain
MRRRSATFKAILSIYPQPRTICATSAVGLVHLLFCNTEIWKESTKMYLGWVTAKNAHFLSLQTAVFCAECELISENSTPYCLACGSQAMLSLSRVLGGSLKGKETAHLIVDAELDRLVRDLLRTVPESPVFAEKKPAASVAMHPGRHHLRTVGISGANALKLDTAEAEIDFVIEPTELDLEPGINIIAERAQTLTGATGAAIALHSGSEMVCRARTGRTAPDLGVRLQTDSGLSAECVRTGEILLCHDAESNPRVDLASCRRLGARSILVAPLRHYRRNLGVFEVLSATPYAFDHRDVSTMQLLSSVMVAAMTRLSYRRPMKGKWPV